MKIWKLMLAMALVLITVFAFAACEKACEHTYDEAITKKATCTEVGEKTFTCSLCGDLYTEEIPLGEHVYVEKPVKPTCTTPGIMTYTCECGATKPDEELEPAKGHDYSTVVTDPTCISDGYTTYTCDECGDSYVGNEVAATGVHTLVTTVVDLTDEQKATNPKAIGMESVACIHCDYAEVTENAVYVFMDFNTAPADVNNYEGSDSFKAITPAGMNGGGPAGKEALVYIDSQEYLSATMFSGNGHGFQLVDGKLKTRDATGYILDDLKLVSVKKCALEKFTLSFDFMIKNAPKTPADASEGKTSMYFGFIDGSNPWDYKNAALVLDLNSMSDDGTAYELVYQHNAWGQFPVYSAPTGFFMTLEKEYSIKMEFDYSLGYDSCVTVYIKEAGTANEYQELGIYGVQCDYGHANSYIFLNQGGNTLDNFKVTAALGAERMPTE